MHICLGPDWSGAQPASVTYPSHLSNSSLLVSLGAMAATAAAASTAGTVVYFRIGLSRARAAFRIMMVSEAFTRTCQTRKGLEEEESTTG